MARIWGLAPLALALAALALPAQALASQTLTVERKGAGAGTVTSSPAGINCGTICKAAFVDGATVTLSGTAGAGTGPVAWAGCDSVSAEDKCKVTMSSAKAITATFPLAKRKLTVERKGTGTGTVTSAPAGIACGTVCSAEFEGASEVTLTAAPGPNTEAVKWSGCTSVDGEGRCKVTMSAAKTVTATFDLAKRELKLKKGGLGAGEVTSAPAGIVCGATCSFLFDEGSTIALTGTPTGETEAVKWSGCDEVTGEGKCVVAMSGAREVGAVFDVKGPTLTIAKLGNGSGTVTSSPAAIECGAACAVNFHLGQSVTLKATSGLHTQPVKWLGCDSVNFKGECLVTMSSAREVTALFSLEPQWTPYTITLGVLGTGKGTVTSVPTGIECPGDCSGEYLLGTSLTLLAAPAPGSAFDHWSVTACGASTVCTTTVKASRQINAVFTAVGTRTLTVSKAGTGAGTVTSKPAGIECGSVCSAEIDASKKVVLKATAAQGSKFKGFSGGGCEGTRGCRVAMSEARNVTASFEKIPGPPPAQCVVPRLAGKAFPRARAALREAGCQIGRVRKPKGAKLAQLRVKSFSPAAGTALPAGSKVSLRLARAKRR